MNLIFLVADYGFNVPSDKGHQFPTVFQRGSVGATSYSVQGRNLIKLQRQYCLNV